MFHPKLLPSTSPNSSCTAKKTSNNVVGLFCSEVSLLASISPVFHLHIPRRQRASCYMHTQPIYESIYQSSITLKKHYTDACRRSGKFGGSRNIGKYWVRYQKDVNCTPNIFLGCKKRMPTLVGWMGGGQPSCFTLPPSTCSLATNLSCCLTMLKYTYH